MSQPVLRTKRLVLEPLHDRHLEHEVALDADGAVMRFLDAGRPATRAETEANHRWRVTLAERAPGLGLWAGFDEAAFVGLFMLEPPHRTDQGPAGGRAELGYRVPSALWRRGYAVEGSRAVVRYAFEDLGLGEVFAETMTVNTGSRAVMAALGMRHVRTFHIEWPDPLPGDEEGDVGYVLTRAEWLAGRSERGDRLEIGPDRGESVGGA